MAGTYGQSSDTFGLYWACLAHKNSFSNSLKPAILLRASYADPWSNCAEFLTVMVIKSVGLVDLARFTHAKRLESIIV